MGPNHSHTSHDASIASSASRHLGEVTEMEMNRTKTPRPLSCLRAWFRNLGFIDIWGQIILCCGVCTVLVEC